MNRDHVLFRIPFRCAALVAALFTAAVTLFAEPAVILYSDGSSRSGELSIMGNRPLILRLPDSKIQRKFQLADLVSITQSVESATMNRPWLYTEAGKVDKTYLEGSYPFINFATEVELVSGEKLKGHLISLAFRLRGGQGNGKLFLTRQIKGKVGETLEEKVYPVTIRFPKAEKSPAKPVTGKLSGYGKLQAATLLDVERNVVCPGTVKADGSFQFPPLLPGNYELYLRTDRFLLYGLAGKPVKPEELDGIRRVVPLADDFFPDRRLLEANGDTKRARALLYKRRSNFYAAEKHVPGGGYVWHLDIWNFHFDGEAWKIDTRQIPVRYKQPGSDSPRKLLKFDRLGRVAPGDHIELKNGEKGENEGQFICNLD